MSHNVNQTNSKDTNVVVYRSDDNTVQLDVQLADETVWLTQQQIASLFGVKQPAISKHLSNIFKEGELDKDSVYSILEYTANDGKTYSTQFYNLDAILSVGYRVNSKNATSFRQWANKVLKDYLLKGYAVNQQLLHIEQRIDNRILEHEKRLDAVGQKIDFFVRTNLPPVEQVFFNGQFFEAVALIERLVKTATRRVIVVDAYVDATTFEMLDVRDKGVVADIYSGKDLSVLRNAHNGNDNVEPINTHIWNTPSHDRWLIIDDSLYHCGHSFKDMGRKLSAITLMGVPPEKVLSVIR